MKTKTKVFFPAKLAIDPCIKLTLAEKETGIVQKPSCKFTAIP